DQVATEQQARRDLAAFQVAGHLVARERSTGANRDRKTEPARLGAGGGFGQNEELFQIRQPFTQRSEVAPAGLHESVQLLQLRQPDRRLHVGELQVVTDVRVGEFMVVPARKAAELPAEPLTARIVAAWFAPTVAAPIAEGRGD